MFLEPFLYMARLAGFEPATYGLEVRCSIQLSYRRVAVFFNIILSLPRREAKAKKATNIASRRVIGNHFSKEKTESSTDFIMDSRRIILV